MVRTVYSSYNMGLIPYQLRIPHLYNDHTELFVCRHICFVDFIDCIALYCFIHLFSCCCIVNWPKSFSSFFSYWINFTSDRH